MRVVVVAKENTDYSRNVSTFLTDFQRQTGKELEQLDPDSRDGADFCRVYDIVRYPTIVALDNGGVLLNKWDGEMLPTINEVSYYVSQN